MKIKIKRIYQEPEKTDGYRILIDRIWPRGISKAQAQLDKWFKEIAPSNELRKSFNHQPELFEKFQTDYLSEIENNLEKKTFLDLVKNNLTKSDVTLLYGAKEEKYNQAVVLKAWLEKNLSG